METPQPTALKRTVMEKIKYDNTIDINWSEIYVKCLAYKKDMIQRFFM